VIGTPELETPEAQGEISIVPNKGKFNSTFSALGVSTFSNI